MTTKILCATDGTSHSKHAVEVACKLAVKLDVPLTICTVNVGRGGARGALIYTMEESEIRKILDDAGEVAASAGVRNLNEVVLRAREAASAVVQYAEEHDFDHIITGTGDKHGVSRLVLGSVAADVASRAHCTVTIVR